MKKVRYKIGTVPTYMRSEGSFCAKRETLIPARWKEEACLYFKTKKQRDSFLGKKRKS